jgi:hypothetical protein
MRHLAYQDEIILGMQDRIEDLYGGGAQEIAALVSKRYE